MACNSTSEVTGRHMRRSSFAGVICEPATSAANTLSHRPAAESEVRYSGVWFSEVRLGYVRLGCMLAAEWRIIFLRLGSVRLRVGGGVANHILSSALINLQQHRPFVRSSFCAGMHCIARQRAAMARGLLWMAHFALRAPTWLTSQTASMRAIFRHRIARERH